MRTRFAPSPTGFLHVGGLRTALYSYLLARQTGGQFLLRIEDTDQERSVPGAVENILKTMAWSGLQPDEGVMLQGDKVVELGSKGPYVQSKRLELYRTYAFQLLEKGHAYYAFDTPEELDRKRESMLKAGHPAPSYNTEVRTVMKNSLTLSKEDVHARLKAGEPYVLRMLVRPKSGSSVVAFTDAIRERVEFPLFNVEDQVLLKSDGFPTYHLAHVVDDHLMDIDMVIRGEEWLPSLPKHVLLFEFLGWEPPQYAHVPLLLNADRTKLSKRQNSVAVEEYVAKGYLPETLTNFLALLGWNPGTTQELFSMDELIKQFSLERVQKAGAVFDVEKLNWLQGQWMRKIPPQEFAERLRPLVAAKFPAATGDKTFERKTALIQDRITFFPEAPDMLNFFYEAPDVSLELLANAKQKVTKELLPAALEKIESILRSIPEKEWSEQRLLATFKEAATGEWKLGQLLWPLRVALTGKPFSPGAVEVACALAVEKGIDEVFARLERAKQTVQP